MRYRIATLNHVLKLFSSVIVVHTSPASRCIRMLISIRRVLACTALDLKLAGSSIFHADVPPFLDHMVRLE